jgi:hypothetical protein
VVDGGSSDGTPAWLAQFCADHPQCGFVSESDQGIYDALNKALPRVRGTWVIFMGAGDTFVDASTLATCQAQLARLQGQVTVAYGGVWWTRHAGETDGKLCYEHWRGLDGPWFSGRPAMPCHQGVFHRSSLFRDGFRFDTRLRIAADGELLLRELLAGHGADLGLVVARVPRDGVSARGSERLRLIAESIRVNLRLGIFWRRPGLQIALLIGNLLKHPMRTRRERGN